MTLLAQVLVAVVAILHLWFFTLESFLWKKPIGLKTFRMDSAQAEATAVLAANQGVYNGFLAAGLIFGLVAADPGVSRAFQLFFLGCVIVAGLVGAATVSRRILYIQAVPAALATALLLLAS